jgi:hypothetical protein
MTGSDARRNAQRRDTQLRPLQGNGDWRSHHTAVPRSPGDFTPVRNDGHHGDEHQVSGWLEDFLDLLEARATVATGRDADPEAGA